MPSQTTKSAPFLASSASSVGTRCVVLSWLRSRLRPISVSPAAARRSLLPNTNPPPTGLPTLLPFPAGLVRGRRPFYTRHAHLATKTARTGLLDMPHDAPADALQSTTLHSPGTRYNEPAPLAARNIERAVLRYQDGGARYPFEQRACPLYGRCGGRWPAAEAPGTLSCYPSRPTTN